MAALRGSNGGGLNERGGARAMLPGPLGLVAIVTAIE